MNLGLSLSLSGQKSKNFGLQCFAPATYREMHDICIKHLEGLHTATSVTSHFRAAFAAFLTSFILFMPCVYTRCETLRLDSVRDVQQLHNMLDGTAGPSEAQNFVGIKF